MIKINVVVKDKSWLKFIKKPKTYLKKKLKKIENDKFFKKKLYNFSLQLSSTKEIKYLNKKFRNKNKSTDVLSFPFHNKKELKKILKKEKEVYIVDIIVNFNKVKHKNPQNFKLEFNKLWIHGLVHLFGYDHKKDKDFFNMLKIEKRFLSYIN